MTAARKTAVHPHVFVADPDLPPDVNGRKVCRCGLLGAPDDAHHAMPSAPAEDARSLAAGEREEGR